jgi:hypothetical protein
MTTANMNDVELGTRPRDRKYQEIEEEETEYRPLNWKKIFLTPKYIRTFCRALAKDHLRGRR